MLLTEHSDLLKNTRLFAALPAAALDQICRAGQFTRIERGAFLFHQGQPADRFYVLLAGQMRLVQHTTDGKDVTMAVFTEGDLIGLIVALTEDAFPGTAEALADSTLCTLPPAVMWSLMNQHAALSVEIVRMMAARLHEAHARIRELSAERVQQRIARSLTRLASKVGVSAGDGAVRLDVRLSRQDLAQMSGTTLETVSRTLSAWEAQGIISAGREQVTIRDSHALMTLAEA